nr:putative reverse transcriptase domain-containing protein [Tanacetum cinerariifolium]
MANPNPKDPNVLNEDVPEEDPYHLLDYDEEEDPEMDTEERIMSPKPMSEARMREIIRDQGTEPTVPELTGYTYATFIKCDPLPFIGTEGAVCLCQWFERLESVFQISECNEKDRVKFAMATLRGRALTWWNGRTKA